MTTAEPNVFAPVLPRIEFDAASHFSEPIRLAPVREQDRPFSHLLRLAVLRPGENTPFAHLFVKRFKPRPDISDAAIRKRVLRDYETNSRVHTALRHYDDIGAVPTVACYPEMLTIVTEEVAGPTLLEHLQAHAGWFVGATELEQLEKTLATAGRWLRAFQATDSGGVVPVASLRAYIAHRVQRLMGLSGHLTAADRDRILSHVDALGAAAPPDDLREVAVHSDLALGNILVSDHRIVVLDFAMAKLGTRFHDLTRLWVQLDVLTTKPQFRAATVRRLQRALLAGYDPTVSPQHPLFRLHALLHRLNQLAKLSSQPGAYPGAAYGWVVRRHHRRRLARELSAPLFER